MTSNKCMNCGATLISNICGNCKAVYKDKPFDGNIDAYFGEVTINGIKMKCYIGDMQVYPIFSGDFGRQLNGEPHYEEPSIKRKITLIEI